MNLLLATRNEDLQRGYRKRNNEVKVPAAVSPASNEFAGGAMSNPLTLLLFVMTKIYIKYKKSKRKENDKHI